MKTVVINLFSGSNTGKSTLAAALFAELKLNHFNSELVQEYIKKWAWSGKRPNQYDQLLVLGKQSNAEAMLYGKVDYIITDSPLLIVPFYEKFLLGKGYLLDTTLNFMKTAEENDVVYLNFWLNRPDVFNQSGRFEDKETAMKIDVLMKDWLMNEAKIDLIELPVEHSERIRIIMEELEKLRN